MSTFLAIVPARGGSKRIPNKNLALLGGHPLLNYTACSALRSTKLSAVVVSTDNAAIAGHAERLGLSVPAMRPAALATDTSSTVEALQHMLAVYEARHGDTDAVVVLQPTSPFRRTHHIDEAITLFEDSRADTVTAVRHARDHPHWAWRQVGDSIEPYYTLGAIDSPRGKLPPALVENGAVYVVRRDLIQCGRMYGPRVVPYVMDAIASVDIDTDLDLAWAEFLLARGLVPGAGDCR